MPQTLRTRKPGAQPGNKNALKHGVYAKRFTQENARKLSEMGRNVDGEIGLLRLHINGLGAKLESSAYDDNGLSQVNCMANLIVSLCTAIRTEAYITGRISSNAHTAVTAILMQRDRWVRAKPK